MLTSLFNRRLLTSDLWLYNHPPKGPIPLETTCSSDRKDRLCSSRETPAHYPLPVYLFHSDKIQDCSETTPILQQKRWRFPKSSQPCQPRCSGIRQPPKYNVLLTIFVSGDNVVSLAEVLPAWGAQESKADRDMGSDAYLILKRS